MVRSAVPSLSESPEPGILPMISATGFTVTFTSSGLVWVFVSEPLVSVDVILS